MTFICLVCRRKFNHQSNLTRHLRLVHHQTIDRSDIQPHDYDTYKYKCLENCQISYKYNRDLRNHLKLVHNFRMLEEHYQFAGKCEFDQWLLDVQSYGAQYIHTTAMKKRITTDNCTLYFDCNRSGKSHLVDDHCRKRKRREGTSIKLNRGCTSQIIVTINPQDIYDVTYYKTHYGHETDLMKFSKQEKNLMATKLLLGLPMEDLLNNCDTNKQLKQKDIYNIRKSNAMRKNQNAADIIDINNWVNECNQKDYNPVLYYNVEGDDICLIIMNEIQHKILHEYVSNNLIILENIELDNCFFELSTLFIRLDGVNVPCVCMISNNSNFAVFERFFMRIRARVGRLQPTAFLSDVQEVYYTAWKCVMGPTVHLYNNHEVDNDWKCNLNLISCDEIEVSRLKRKWVYDTLHIIRSITDEIEFLDNYQETIKLLESDPDFKDFLIYLSTFYLKYVKKWAFCYRKQFNSNIKTESASNVLKDYILEEIDLRFDKLFLIVIRFIRNSTMSYMIGNDTDKCYFTNMIYLRHPSKLNDDYICEQIDANIWNIKSDDGDTHFIVRKHLDEPCCDLQCNLCMVCPHSYSCSCADFFVHNTICEHIHHLVCFQMKARPQDGDDEEIVIEIEATDENGVEMQKLRDDIQGRLAALSESIAIIDDNDLLINISQNLDNLCENMDENLCEKTFKTVLDDHSYL